MTDKTIRQEIRAYVDAVLESGDPVDPKIAARHGVEAFSLNQEITARWFRETAYDLFYQVFINRLSQRRSSIAHATQPRTKSHVAEVLAQGPPDFGRWMERDPETGVQSSLLDLLKEQVLAAAEARNGPAMTELRRVSFLRLVAGRLKDGQRVGEVWNDDLLTDLMQRIDIKVKTSLKGIKPAIEEAADQ
jgi:hypothetical protein